MSSQLGMKSSGIADRVAAWLRDSIERGQFSAGERLPSVEQLARDLGVGRSSIREALRHLQALGMVELRHGRGTFVASSKVHLGSSLSSFSESVRRLGMRPGAVVLRREVVRPEPAVAASLNLREGERVNLLQRLRLADGEPLAIETSYTPYAAFPDLLDGRWTLDSSLYELLGQKYGVVLAYARQTVSAALLTENQSQLLQVPKGGLAIEVYTVCYTPDDTPIEYAQSVYRADRYQYTVTLRRRS